MEPIRSLSSLTNQIPILQMNHNKHTDSKSSHFKGGSGQSHFIFEINVRKSRIRHRTTLKLNDNRF